MTRWANTASVAMAVMRPIVSCKRREAERSLRPALRIIAPSTGRSTASTSVSFQFDHSR